ncbi:MAG: hypothetical protein J0I07_11550 [Myxococcales bacterium]|nr:hypothetical protein [Myxococcales bacterium]
MDVELADVEVWELLRPRAEDFFRESPSADAQMVEWMTAQRSEDRPDRRAEVISGDVDRR